MASDGRPNPPHDNAGTPFDMRGPEARNTPEWADGLKQLYDAVVEEKLPDQFLDLLAQLDEQDGQPFGHGGSRPGQGNVR